MILLFIANVAARQTELDSAVQTPTGSHRVVQSQSVKGTLQFLHIVEKLKVHLFKIPYLSPRNDLRGGSPLLN